uniref:Ras-related protein Rab-18 n=1 Tax=Grammatophora oceanica TaxID=210454 RepID=A0A7S1VU41_9STRA|mmetsp:Transcript_5605/g.7812  ORF Transcript_5605/g.7812 Transcript_5605/m.7812 type:complete len:233 (+) Transcript_5605:286-984(+)|eukprot:CAMPEP_0194047066 /NCGR_PEP_ID=MMETSP0009_2-20130614/23539_1 /TAXON_ID=210454 /ORGANISM="Grammatophora oceanica, Strain CCMP 410" /LENGTH=232 /DNA_ID=CAMNT_0038692581 /DNA_START=269 /DNA_END=967 /DNA_ORIENTATION=-
MSTRATSTSAKPPLYKIVMLGDSGVGKTSLVARLTNPDRPMNHDISATMGIEFDTQMLDTPQGKVKAQIWDTAGQERFARVLLPTYFRKAKGVILVFDITNMKSFESLSERWMAQLNDHANSEELAKLLVGNKSDLEANREVTKDVAMKFCEEHGMELLETSAKSGENVLQAFEKLVSIVHDRALASNKAKGGIKGMPAGNNTGAATNNTIKLENGDGEAAAADNTASACGC